MVSKQATRIVAIEEHYWDAEMAAHFKGKEGSRNPAIERRLKAFGDDRLKDMDEAGVDYAILSHGPPAAQKIAADIAVPLCRRVNDRLAEVIRARPSRFGGFAVLPTDDPEAAADELERCIGMGFAGAMIHGPSNGEFIDGKRFWPIFARAERLDVPIYLHPAWPMPEVSKAYYDDYLDDFPMLSRAAWGYGVENGTAAVRLILSGLFDEHPAAKIILGHLGESVPFQLTRLAEVFNRPGGRAVDFRRIFTTNFWVTTSGFFSTPALNCCLEELGSERILFAVDWPFVSNSRDGTKWLEDAPIGDAEKAKIFSGNAEALFRLSQADVAGRAGK